MAIHFRMNNICVLLKKVLEFLELFYDSIVVLSSVYEPTSSILHHIIEIASYLHTYEHDNNLRDVVVRMKLNFLKY